MKRSFRFNRLHKPMRDFLCALVIFSALFAMMSPTRYEWAPIPVLSLISGSSATAADYRRNAVSDVANGAPIRRSQGLTYPKTFSQHVLPRADMPLISTLLALVFSSIIAFNLALLRHLRRVNASSRRGAWKEG